MRASILSIAFVGAWLVPTGVLYWILSDEYAGIVLLLLGGVAMFGLAAYLVGATRGTPPGPDDDESADPGAGTADGPVPVLRAVPPASVWPALIAAGAAIVAYGLAFTPWIWLPGLAFLALALAGYARETSP
ncbi:MAG: cytochrome c oxidase subunit 4 [Acidimicrobiales bacterium]